MTGRADRHEPLDEAVRARWTRFSRPGDQLRYPGLLGFVVEDVRRDYCRMRMPLRPELLHAGGVVHGGAIASLLDTVMVPAIGASLEPGTGFATVDLHVQYLQALSDDDAVAEGWVVRRGRRTVFGRSEVVAARSGRLVATSACTYQVADGAA